MGNCASMESDAAGRVRTSKKRRKLDDRKAKDGNGGEISFLAENGADLSSSGRKKGRGKTKRGNVRSAAVGVGNTKHGAEGVCDMMQQGAAPSEEEDVVRHCSNALSLPSNSSRSNGESAAGLTIKSPLLMTGARGGGFNSSNNNNNNNSNNIDEPAAVTNPLLPPSVAGIARSPTMPPRSSPFIEPGAPERMSKFAFDEVLENSTSAVSSKSAEHRRGSGSTATPSLAVTAPSSAALCRMPRSPPGVVGSTTDAPRSPAVALEKTHDPPAAGVVAPQPTDVAAATEQPTSPLLCAPEKPLEGITNTLSHSHVQQSRSPRLSPSRKLAQQGRTSPRVVRASPVGWHHMRAPTEASVGDSADDDASTELPPMVLGYLQDDATTQLQPATSRFSGGHEGGARSSSSRSNGGGGSDTRPPPVPNPNGNGSSPTAAAAAVGSEQQFSITHRRRYESNASSLASKTSSSNLSSLTTGSSSNFSRGTRSGPSAGVSPSSRFREDAANHHLPTFGMGSGLGSSDYGSGSDDRRESASRRSTTNTSRGFSTFSLDAFFDNNHQRTASMPRNAQQRIVSFRGGLDDNNADDGRSPSMAMTDFNDDGARRDTSASLVSNRSRMHSGSSSSVWSASSATAAVVGGGGRRAQTMTLATFQAA